MPILSREATKGSASFSTAQPPFEGMERVGTKNRVHAPQDTLLSVNGAVRHFASEFSSASSSYSASQYVVEGGNRGYGAGFQGVNESDERERARWRTRVNAALELIARGELAKVVLARKKVCTLRDPLEPAAVLARVRDHRPACLNFWIAGAKSSFIGSTPELLLRLRARRFVCGALAGSAARASDATRDRAQARALLASAKNAYEHQLVVAAIAAALRPVARELRIAKQPRIRVFPEAFHLYTPISGVLRGRLSALELAGILHPTPAVCGVPTARAREILARQEADRGWYAGCVGWIDARGDGEFAVALRSALIERKRIVGWAGAGIVAGSDPEAEFAETEDKLSALFTVLQS
jgi:isochorismate synthase